MTVVWLVLAAAAALTAITAAATRLPLPVLLGCASTAALFTAGALHAAGVQDGALTAWLAAAGGYAADVPVTSHRASRTGDTRQQLMWTGLAAVFLLIATFAGLLALGGGRW